MNFVILISKKEIKENLNTNLKSNIGAIVSFKGIIKEKNNNKQVTSIIYFIFEKLFYNVLKKKCISILKNNKVNIYINQVYGELSAGKINLIVSVESSNRKKAFIICHKIVEFIKYNAPIWKKEIYEDGSFMWINV